MYFTYLHSYCQPGNSLQNQALDLLKAESNLLIDDPQAFIGELEAKIDKLNAENPRCRPLTVYTWDGSGESLSYGVSLGSYYTVNFRLHRVREAAGDRALPADEAGSSRAASV